MVLLTSDTSEVASQIADTISEKTEENVKQVNILLQYIQDHIPDILSFGIKIIFAFVIFIVGKKIIKWIRKLVHGSMERASVEVGAAQFADSIVKYALYAFLLMLILRNFGVDSTSVAAVVASAGVAVGLALQDSFSNIAGGILLMILKPFSVGDYIICGAYEGTITEIQVYYSKMLTADNRAIIIPNGELSSQSLVNVTNENERRLDLQVSISYEADLKYAKEVLRQIVMNDDAVIKDKDILIVVDDLADSSVLVGVKVWVPTDDYWTAKWRILENIKIGLNKADVEISYNKMEVHLKGGKISQEVR